MSANPNYPGQDQQLLDGKVVAYPERRINYRRTVVERPAPAKVDKRHDRWFGLVANKQDMEHEDGLIGIWQLGERVELARRTGLALDVGGVKELADMGDSLEAIVADTRPNSLSGQLAEDAAAMAAQHGLGTFRAYQELYDTEAIRRAAGR